MTTTITQSNPIEPEPGREDIVEEIPTLTKGRTPDDGPITAGIFRLAAKAATLAAAPAPAASPSEVAA